jgi:hypothetical protein
MAIIVQKIGLLEITDLISRKNKKLQAVALSQIESLLLDQPEIFTQIRKVYLDSMNDFARLILTALYQDVEKPEMSRVYNG